MSKGRMFWQETPSAFRLLGLLALAALLPGCGGGGGSDSYAEPATVENPAIQGASTNVLVGPATLKSWMDQGLAAVKATSFNNQRVVILDYASGDADPRITGAYKAAKTDLVTTRTEGVTEASTLVATGAMMDALIQAAGIDENTTLVFTTSASPLNATRAYWTFRYWGFPKERLKFLNGGNTAFAAAYPELMSQEEPTFQTSTYSVRDLDQVNTDLRASIDEMLQLFDGLPQDGANLVIDARGDGYYNGTSATSGLLTSGSKVVVDGHPDGGQYLSYASLLNDDNTFKTAAEIQALFEEKGWTAGKKVTAYCTSGFAASQLFFALDAILDAPVQLYDGSWSQMGKYSDWAAAGGELPSGSPWAIDGYLATAKYNYENPTPLTIETLQLDAAQEADAPFTGNVAGDDSDVNAAANDIETADAAAVGAVQTVNIDDPTLTDTASILIEPATLQSWMDADLVNQAQGSERVVLLDVTSSTSYEAGHIPGAQLWDTSQQVEQRVEGPAPAVNMVVTPERMNELIQAHGIDQHTTIVLTTSGHPLYPGRAYFLFRYYGWPKSRLKVLNGYNGAWDSSELTTEAPTVPASTLTVQQIGNLQPDVRVSLVELMDGLRDGRGKAVDVRGDSSAAGSTSGVFSDVSGDYVVFEGRPNNGAYFSWADFMVDYSNGDQRLKSAADLRSALSASGVTSNDGPIYSYCRTGMLGSLGFLVFDGILGWDTMLYDGSWSQFGKLSTEATGKGGELPAGSLWAVDNATYMEVVNYNMDKTQAIEALNPDSSMLSTNPLTSPPNQVEEADTTYQSQGSASPTGEQAPTPTDSPAIGC